MAKIWRGNPDSVKSRIDKRDKKRRGPKVIVDNVGLKNETVRKANEMRNQMVWV